MYGDDNESLRYKLHASEMERYDLESKQTVNRIVHGYEIDAANRSASSARSYANSLVDEVQRLRAELESVKDAAVAMTEQYIHELCAKNAANFTLSELIAEIESGGPRVLSAKAADGTYAKLLRHRAESRLGFKERDERKILQSKLETLYGPKTCERMLEERFPSRQEVNELCLRTGLEKHFAYDRLKHTRKLKSIAHEACLKYSEDWAPESRRKRDNALSEVDAYVAEEKKLEQRFAASKAKAKAAATANAQPADKAPAPSVSSTSKPTP